MMLASYIVNMCLRVTTHRNIIRFMRPHYGIKSKEQIQICWFSTLGRVPVIFLYLGQKCFYKP